MSDDVICPCDEFIHPEVPENPPGRRAVAYRTGDFTSFRAALLRELPGEQQLEGWRPNADGSDLALQMVEWWAYLADILTFYNERIANDTYLRTATRREVMARIVALIGHRPRPPLAALGKVAALSTAKASISVPKGLGIQSKPGPGKLPMIVETDKLALVEPGGALPVEAIADTKLNPTSVLIKGAVSGVKPGDGLLLVKKGWTPSASGYAWVIVKSLAQEKDPAGKSNTRITWETAVTSAQIPSGTLAKDCRLLRSNRQEMLWQTQHYPIEVIGAVTLNGIAWLVGHASNIVTGDWVVLRTSAAHYLAQVKSCTFTVRYENGDSGPLVPLPDEAPLQVPITLLAFDPLPSPWAGLGDIQSALRVLHNFADVGEIIDDPPAAVTGSTFAFSPGAALPKAIKSGAELFLEDVAGKGALCTVQSASSGKITVACKTPVTLTAPLRLLYNLVPVSQGKTVTGEILGNGDAAQAGQSFVLSKSPVTYFAGGAPSSSLSFRSSVRILVNGSAWSEVDSFVDQKPGARVFVTREDDEGKTHVLFGDGVNGARLPTGKGNVVASYRYGAGGDSPDPGALATLLQSVTDLSAIRSPVPVSGQKDAEPAAQMARYAPLSTFAFGRAISLDDFEAIALSSGARRARAYHTWDADRQMAMVKVYVGDDTASVDAARNALAPAVDPNVPYAVVATVPQRAGVALALRIDPAYDVASVFAAVRDALLDPEGELFGAAARIGEAIYNSQIAGLCLDVPGVLEVTNMAFVAAPSSAHVVSSALKRSWSRPVQTGTLQTTTSSLRRRARVATERRSPGEGGVFALTAETIWIATEGGGDVLGQ
ncbi:MAG: hypothetical protein QM820_35185 [Minicystis sp.]